MSEESDDEKAEKASLLDRGGKFLMPEAGLAPWGSFHKEQRLLVVIKLNTTAQIQKELRRQVWNLHHPAQPLQRAEGDEPDPDIAPFDETEFRGADSVVAYGLNMLATNIHNYAPSEKGLRVEQILKVLQAQKTGIASEPKKKTLWQKITGKNKPQAGEA